ncbi:aminotransferase class 3 [Grosmannia clavigera kw1407]|uniref:Aminotransferase class 3 n=1 Tax=Grosmannia clavigera (strain kw1407 / UAMH 11150) TaxID=655863 RepID=F0XAM0_GROCL|nr:aminotransferase class 3 [Grosmannia clavigera kw1407]EFX06000.1 aminotransferase class 3 [Grosmannia clavigera kw1407]
MSGSAGFMNNLDLPSGTHQKHASAPTSASSPDRGLPLVLKTQGHHIYVQDGREILDACGGAAVTCLGHGNQEVLNAMNRQAQSCSYVPYAFFDNQSTRNLEEWLVRTSNGVIAKVYLVSSGSEAMDGAMKLAREFFVWTGQPQRVNFIACKPSYHGTTLGALSLSGHISRRAPFQPLLMGGLGTSLGTSLVEHVTGCNTYRQQQAREADARFVARKAAELEAAFQRLGPATVCAFVVEPVVGAAAGCMPVAPGYLAAMKAVCARHGALLVLDEVMCGMGRTGTLHAWQHEMDGGDASPDIQTVGKGLGGGFQPCAAILAGRRVVTAMHEADGALFTHGHTYQNHPVASAAAFCVQTIIQRDSLLANVRARGAQLGVALHAQLDDHPHVGDIRGRGLFWGIELVQDRGSREPFPIEERVAKQIHDLALTSRFQLLVYYGQGCAGDSRGDHIMIMPAYTVTEKLVTLIVDTLTKVIHEVFSK